MSISLGSLAIMATIKTSFEAPNTTAIKGIVIGNESPLSVIITMESGGVQKTLYPSTVDWFQVNPGFTGNILINPTAILNNGAQWPSSSLVFDAIGINDPESPNMYPVSLNRGTNIGNNVPLSGSTTSIANDGNAANTSIVEATVSGDISSAVKITNDAQVTLGTTANPGAMTVKGVITAPAANLFGTAGNLTTILGKLTVVQQLNCVRIFSTPAATTINGSTSGTASLIMPLQGNFKIALVDFNTFQNGGASDQTITIPTAFTSSLFVLAGDTPNISLLSSGSAVTIHAITTLGGGSTGGSTTDTTIMHQYVIGDVWSGIDTVSMKAGGVQQHNGILILVGQ